MHLSSWTRGEVEPPFDEKKFYELLCEKINNSAKKDNVVSAVADTDNTYNS